MLIRRETAHDVAAVDAIHAAAFARPDADTEPPEVELVRRLRRDAGWLPELSLVAEHPTTGHVIGHVVCTIGSIDHHMALGLGPLGVVPEEQLRGVGHALMHSVIGAADATGHGVVVLLGAVAYYSRFGFVVARGLGIVPTDPGWGDHFQARPLHAWRPEIAGTFRYAAPFDVVG